MAYRNILIVKLSAIGDVIHALPVAHALKNAFPKAQITWAVEKPALDLVTDHPYIDEVVLFDKTRCRTLPGLISYLPDFVQRLKQKNFDLALDLQGLFKSGIITLLSGAPKKLVYCNAREFSDWVSKKVCGPNQNGHIIDQYLDVVRSLGAPKETIDFGIRINEQQIKAVRQILKNAGWEGQPYVVLIPGANWPNKRWPPLYFAVLADRLNKQGLAPVLIGGPADLPLAQQILARAETRLMNLIGKTSLKQLAWVIKNAQVAVGGDTGPMHLSVAVNTPTLALIGPTDTHRNGPYGKAHKSLITSRDCTGCWQRDCQKKLDCLDAISVDEVYQSILELFKDSP